MKSLRAALTVAAAALWQLGASGCSNDLPAASFIDKLRVLAVHAQPPEIAPGGTATLDFLAVEPRVHQLDGGPAPAMSAQWFACALPPGSLTIEPCGANARDLGSHMTASYPADANLLGSAASTQILITVVVADTEAGAQGCAADIAANDGLPKDPDHCVVALKRLTVSDPAQRTVAVNQNPTLASFTATAPSGFMEPLVDDPQNAGVWVTAPGKDKAEWTLAADRDAAAAEMKADGSYEALTVSWFTTAGRLDGGRSLYLPDGCNEPSSCPDKVPEIGASTSWFAPTADEAAPVLDASGLVQFWAVIRDDRGGVSWRSGLLGLQR